MTSATGKEVSIGPMPPPDGVILQVDFGEEHRDGDPGWYIVGDPAGSPARRTYHPTFSASHILISD
jgi:hypothetical protein